MRLSESMCGWIVVSIVGVVNVVVATCFGFWWLVPSIPLSAVAGLFIWLLLLMIS
jgi:hypothetical protein